MKNLQVFSPSVPSKTANFVPNYARHMNQGNLQYFSDSLDGSEYMSSYYNNLEREAIKPLQNRQSFLKLHQASIRDNMAFFYQQPQPPTLVDSLSIKYQQPQAPVHHYITAWCSKNEEINNNHFNKAACPFIQNNFENDIEVTVNRVETIYGNSSNQVNQVRSQGDQIISELLNNKRQALQDLEFYWNQARCNDAELNEQKNVNLILKFLATLWWEGQISEKKQ